MVSYKIGDLVQCCSSATRPSRYQKNRWNNKIGVVVDFRTKAEIAYVKWSDPDLNDTWIGYEDLMLLNRE